MQDAGKSRHLRELGRLMDGNNYALNNLKHDVSSINEALNQSNSIDSSLLGQINSKDQKDNSKILNNSLIHHSIVEEHPIV